MFLGPVVDPAAAFHPGLRDERQAPGDFELAEPPVKLPRLDSNQQPFGSLIRLRIASQ